MRIKHLLLAAPLLLLVGCGHKKYKGDDQATVPPPGGDTTEQDQEQDPPQDQQQPTFTRHCLSPASADIATTVDAVKKLANTTDCSAAQQMLSAQSAISLKGIKLGSLEPLSDLKGLKQLDLSETGVSDLSTLKGLSALETLNVSENSLNSGVPLAQFPALKSLNATNSKIEGTAWLAGTCKLTRLELSGNALGDFSGIKKCPALTDLGLARTKMTDDDSAVLTGLNVLSRLNVAKNKLTSVAFTDQPSAMTASARRATACPLTSLNISDNALEDLSGIARCKGLAELNLDNTKLSDAGAEQAGIAGLTELTTLSLTLNKLTTLAFASTLTKLTTVNASNNQIASVEPLRPLAGLEVIRMTNNRVNSLAPLKAHKNLTKLAFVSNPVFTWDKTYAERCPSQDTGSKVLADICARNIKRRHAFLWHCLNVTDPEDSRYRVVQQVLEIIRESQANCVKGYAKLQSEPGKLKRNLNLSSRQARKKLENLDPLRDSVFSFIPRLSLDNNEIKNLLPLQAWTGLRYLSANNNPITVMVALGRLSNLRELRLANTDLRNASFVTPGHPLEKLFINGPKLESYAGIEKLPKLTSIQLAASPKVKELGVITTMSQLRGLNIMANPQFTNFDFSQFPNLDYLGLVDQSKEPGYLANLGLPASLVHLDARYNGEDTASFNLLPAIVPNLKSLNVLGNAEVKSLAGMKGLGEGQWDELAAFCANSVPTNGQDKAQKECPTSKVPSGIAAYCRGEGSGLPGCPETFDGFTVEPFEEYLKGNL